LYLNNCLECRGLEENGLLQDSLNLSRDLGLKNTEAQVLELVASPGSRKVGQAMKAMRKGSSKAMLTN